jgi:4-hydroxy-L-threonine phosphate dehydrogenase PdxA
VAYDAAASGDASESGMVAAIEAAQRLADEAPA